ncbi:helix-turn-helix domain-containing protein [Inquilinus sp.]|uniref:TetR/AcrR family transcriptional regulator n=1 Tax=Inquilinus sp. TaxID=1932117 RepID=UPI0031D6AD02
MTGPDRLSRKRKQTRDHIAATAHALFERHGYEAVSMEQIAAEADVARGTLYNHFPVKEAVLAHSMHAELGRDLVPLMHGVLSRTGFASRLAELFQASARWWDAHRQLAAPYIRYRFQGVGRAEDGEASSDMVVAYVRLITDAQDAGEIRRDAPAGQFARYLHFLYLCAVMTWLGDAGISLEKELAQALDFFLAGAAA